MHCASLFTRSQENEARKVGRTRYASAWSAEVGTPEDEAIPLPHTSFTSAFGGSVRAQANVTSGESDASRRRRNFSSSLPVAASRKVKLRERALALSRKMKRR